MKNGVPFLPLLASKKQPAEKTCPLPNGSPFLPGWILEFVHLLILAYGFVSKFETFDFALASSSVAFLVFVCLFVLGALQ